MNCLKIFLIAWLLFAVLLQAFEVNTPFFKADLSIRGAVITSLSVKGKKWLCSIKQLGSFTDRIGQNLEKELQGLADTAEIDFNITNHTVSKNGTKITFSSCIAVIPGLRMEKSYFFSSRAPLIKVEYRFKNLGKKPLPLSLYTRSLFRCSEGKSIYYQPGPEGIRIVRQGVRTAPVKLPRQTFLAVADEKGAGFIHKFPADDTAGLLNWIIKGGYTQEYLSSQRIIMPGQSRILQIELLFTDNVAAALKKTDLKAKKLNGVLPVQVDRMCRIKPKTKLQIFRSVPAPAEKFIDLSFRRQPEDTWRAVELPPGQEKSPLAVYALEDGTTAPDRPLEFARKGKNIVIRIPGILRGKRLYVNRTRFEKDLLFNGSYKSWHGPLTMKCRILFDTAGGKEVNAAEIPAEGALILNGSMEKISKNTLKEKSGNTFLRIKKSASFNFFPEHQKEYHLSVRARAVIKGGSSRILVQFFDKSGKYIRTNRLVVLSSGTSFGWKKIEKRFYVPENGAFLRIYFLHIPGKDQIFDIDDLKLTLAPESSTAVDRKQVLRDELDKLWKLPLELLETISHELVTPHKKWFKPAAVPVSDILFLSGVTQKISDGRRREIVELAQRMNIKYTHIPLIPAIKNMVRAYSVYPTTFYPRLSDYSMEQLKTLKKPPRIICFTGVNFKQLSDKPFLALLENWQKQGINFMFYRCTAVPPHLRGKPVKTPLKILLPKMSPGPNRYAGAVYFYRNGKTLNSVIEHNARKNSIVPAAQLLESSGDYRMLHSPVFPWWEYNYLQALHALRALAGIKPAAVLAEAASGFAVRADKDFKGTLEISVENMHREKVLTKQLPVTLAAGKRLTIRDDLDLPGGIYVADLRLLDTNKRVVDAGAVRLKRKEITPLSLTLKNKENIFPYPQKVSFTVSAPSAPPKSRIEVEIFNQRKEILFRSQKTAAAKLDFAASLPHLRTFFNYIRVRLVQNGRILAAVTQEFSVPGIPREMNEFYGFINTGGSESSALKDLGFDFAITGDPRWHTTLVRIKRLRSLGLHPIPRRSVKLLFAPYRSDAESAPVRTPCFTSPAFHDQLKKDIKAMVENGRLRYYDVNMLWCGDEMFLGRSVCTSPSCLAGFRRYLKKSFGTVEALNKNWRSSFKSFAEVMPQQLKELKNKDHLGPWLDHKMYMTKVFAENFFGKTKTELGKYVPNVKIGPTGTQKPGLSYNWNELMKYCQIVGYYSGVQTKVIHDFADASLMAGQCGGGYTHGHIDYEAYNYNSMWTSLLNGGNLAYHYYGCAIRGDLAPTRNLLYYSTSLKELKSGIGKLYLSALPRHDVAVLYSQSSLFAAMGSCGEAEWQNSQTSWTKLLDDLRVSSRFISYEELAQKGVPAGIKAVVLPFSLSLSDAEIASLARFAAAGGTVIADCNTALFNGHGRKRSSQERRVQLKFLKSLNYSIARYNFVQLSGTGGEISSSGSGDEKFIRKCRADVMALLKKGNVSSFVKLTDLKGNGFGCMAKYRFDGPTQLYGFHQTPEKLKPGRFKDSDAKKVIVTLPEAGYVYDIRNKKFLGRTARWQMDLIPGKSLIYGVVPVKPESVTLEIPAGISRGGTLRMKAAVTPAAGAQVFRFTLTGPDGKELPRYAVNFRSTNNRAVKEFFLPFNAAKGKYTVTVTHILSNLSCSRSFELR